MNNVNLIGRLTKDVELRKTKTGKDYAFINLAVNQGENVNFISCQVWEKNALNLAKYCGKGSQIAIQGSLSTYANDTKQTIMNVVAFKVQFLSKPNKKTDFEKTDFEKTDFEIDSMEFDFVEQNKISTNV